VLIAGIIWALDRASTPARIDKAFTSPDVRTMTTNSGQRGAVNLRDGGRVTLGPRSTLTIPPGYGEGLRVVRLEGSAQLSAAEGGERIETRLAVAPVTVTGTSYSVSAYPAASEYFITANDSDAEVTVNESAHALPAGDALAVDSSGAVREPSTAEVDEALGWTGGQFVVNERPLREALAAIRLAYGVEIAVADSSLLDRRVSARGPITSSSEAIAALEQSGNLKFGYEGEQMMLRDAAPDPRPR
jgi:ferric-dicitrate binding protein FerR (iron transport regulator)